MIVMLDMNKMDQAQSELQCEVEQLLTPLTRFKRQREGDMFCVDNGAFSKFDSKGFMSLLEREQEHINLCRFVAVPDVVGSATRTLETWEHWMPKLKHWPLAFVCQDGMENFRIPWSDISAVFIGGTTDWKMSQSAIQIIKAAQVIGKWTHVGRVNTPGRFEHFESLGVDSVDGSGLARYSHMRKAIYENSIQGKLI